MCNMPFLGVSSKETGEAKEELFNYFYNIYFVFNIVVFTLKKKLVAPGVYLESMGAWG